MINHWFDFLKGTVTVKVTGRGTERFVNILTRNNYVIRNVERHSSETITFKMGLQEAKNIRNIAKDSECTISFIQRDGFPLLLKRFFKNSGFLTGAFIFFVIILFLSNMIWGIEIKGAMPATEYEIRKELDKMGVKTGKPQFFVENVVNIQKQLTNNIYNLTWVGIELKGTTYHLQVVEKKEPEKQKQMTPRNLVAKKKATIITYYVENGQRVIDKNEQVKPGQLLVSGIIGSGENQKLVPAEGEVWGETWYESVTKLRLETDLKVLTGKEKQKYSILFGKLNIPIWGLGTPNFNSYETEVDIHKIHFLKWELPISYVNRTIRESEEVTKIYSKKQAEKIAIERAKKELKSSLDEDAIIKDAYILEKTIKNGELILALHIRAIENIAIEKPITEENDD